MSIAPSRQSHPQSLDLSAALLALFAAALTFWIAGHEAKPPDDGWIGPAGRQTTRTHLKEVEGLNHLDTHWYFDIAEHGYRVQEGQSNVVFFPLMPLLTSLVEKATGLPVSAAGVLVALLASMAAAIGMARYARTFQDDWLPLAAVLVLLMHPMGVFLHAAYPESLFIALTMGLLLAARRGSIPLVAALSFALALTRPQGLFVPLAFLVADGLVPMTFAAGGATVAAVLAFALHLQLATGDPWSFWTKRAAWDAHASVFNIPELLLPVFSRQHIVAKLALYLTLTGAVMLWRRGEKRAAVLAALFIILPLQKGDLGDLTRYSLLASFAAIPLLQQLPRLPYLIAGGLGAGAILHGMFLVRFLNRLWVG